MATRTVAAPSIILLLWRMSMLMRPFTETTYIYMHIDTHIDTDPIEGEVFGASHYLV